MKQFFITLLVLFSTPLFFPLSARAQTTPAHAIVGYWQDWGATTDDPPYIPLANVDSRYNVIEVAFTGTDADDATLTFAPNSSDFAAGVKTLQSQGKKVLLSIGGANGTLLLTSAANTQAFISSLESILDQYNFDGFDLDLEGGTTLELNNDDNNFMAPTTPKVVNLISACQQVIVYRQAEGKNCWLTMAPETYYVQTAFGSGYSPLVGAQLPIIYGLRNQLTILQVQLYNTGTVYGLDGNIYGEGTADFIVAMTEMLMTGFPVSGTSQTFPALRPDQIAVGLPATAGAGGGYCTPAIVTQALNYLVHGVSYGGAYKLRNPAGYPGLNGAMTWSINWDKSGGNSFVGNVYNFFYGNTGTTAPSVSISSPAAGASYIAPATITIKAAAADSGATVSSVAFYNGGTLLGTSTASPSSFNWTNVAAGTYSLTAIATNNSGLSTTSAAISVTVTDTSSSGSGPGGNCTGLAAWNAATAYNGGAQVVYNDSLYSAKWWTQGNQPDISTGDGQPWQLVSACSIGTQPPPSDSTSSGNGSGNGSGTDSTGSGSSGNCSGIPTYQSYPAVYNQGDEVVYNGVLYQSTSNSLYNVTPGTANWWWTPLGTCSTATTSKLLNGQASIPTATDSIPLAVYPNPVTGAGVQVQLSTAVSEKLAIEVSSVSGSVPVIRQEWVAASAGPQLILIDLSNLPTGIWMLRVLHSSTGRVETTKLIRLH
jgi:chitinase